MANSMENTRKSQLQGKVGLWLNFVFFFQKIGKSENQNIGVGMGILYSFSKKHFSVWVFLLAPWNRRWPARRSWGRRREKIKDFLHFRIFGFFPDIFRMFFGFFRFFPAIFGFFYSRNHSHYKKFSFWSKRTLYKFIKKYKIWIFDLGILILDRQNSLEWPPEQKKNHIFFKNLDEIHNKSVFSYKVPILSLFGH